MARSFKRVAVIGGDGVFGVHMHKLLLGRRDIEPVVSIGRNQRKPPLHSLDVGHGDPRFAHYPAHMVQEHDILMRILEQEQPVCIINFAALAYATSWGDYCRDNDASVVAIAQITEAIRGRDYFKYWLQIDFPAVSGAAIDARPCSENSPANPTSPPAVSKLAGDMHLKTHFNGIAFPMNVIRPSNAYGPGQQLHRLMPSAAFCPLTGQTFPLEGGGVAEKSFIQATNLAAAVHLIMTQGRLVEYYNWGTESAVSIRHFAGSVSNLVELTAAAADVDSEFFVTIAPGSVTEDSRYGPDSIKINDQLDRRPRISLESVVAKIVEWARANLGDLKLRTQQFSLRS